MTEKISSIKPRQVRFTEKVDSHIRESAKDAIGQFRQR